MRPRILSIPGPAVSGPVDGRGGRIIYWAFRETSGGAGAIFRFWDGSNNQGSLVAPFTLDPGESVREVPGLHGVPYRVGLFLEVLSGTIEGQVTIILAEDYPESGGVPVFVVGSVDLTFNQIG
jgi:hypothetical protein